MANIYLNTFGCTVNLHESEVIKGILKKAGHSFVEDIEDSELVILNVCTVKGNTKALREIRKVSELHKKLVVSGCIAHDTIAEIRDINEECSLISTHNILHIEEVVEETLNENAVEMFGESDNLKINIPKIRRNKIIGIIPISKGCLGNCAYCSVKLIKGNLCSYSKEKILEECSAALRQGCKELWVTSQDTGCYGQDIGDNLVNLLSSILSLEADFRLRLGMANPNFVLKYLDELINVFKDKKMFKFLHIPVQSGNDRVLNEMDRKYNVEDFKKIVKRFREEIPSITISTDVICGFPGETDQEFNDSVNLIKEVRPDVINIARFVKRPGTKAYSMEQLQPGTGRERSRRLSEVFKWVSFENNKRWLNKEVDVIVDEYGKDDTFISRMNNYKQVVLDGKFVLGEKVKVKIVNLTEFYLIGSQV